jgi:Na+/H+ antiporter NhaD/arsenite permease-like protein
MNIDPIWLTTGVFLFFYVAIVLEEWLGANRVLLALGGAVTLWGLLAYLQDPFFKTFQALQKSAHQTAQITLFLLCVMMLVEWIRQNQGFERLRDWLLHDSAIEEVWRLTWLTFFLSAVIDNMTSTLIMLTIIKGRYLEPRRQWTLVSLIVLASNAGGAWSPIGDVTTTMLWIEGKVSAWGLIRGGVLAALVNCLIPLLLCTPIFRGKSASHMRSPLSTRLRPSQPSTQLMQPLVHLSKEGMVLSLGLLLIVMIPLASHLLDLAPSMVAFSSLLIVALLIDPIFYAIKNTQSHQPPRQGINPSTEHFGVLRTFLKLDWSSVFFIFGILLCMGVLDETGFLSLLSGAMHEHLGAVFNQALTLGFLSAFLDNIPLVSASLGIYDPSLYPLDHPVWLLLAYCAGTGGSLLILGSAAGIVAMGQEGLKFTWYLLHFSWKALLGYLAGAFIFWLMR